MKKVLFATTAIVATASVAAAEVTIGGSGRFGIVYNEAFDNVANRSTTKIEKRITFNIDGSGSTDGGLDFGGRIRLRSDEGEAASAQASGNVWMGNDMFRITVGNTNGAMVQRIGYYQGSVGLTGLQWANVSFNIGSSSFDLNSYSSRGGGTADVVRLDFNVAGFGISASTASTGDHSNGILSGGQDSLAVSYAFGDWTAALGFANIEAVGGAERDVVSASVVGSIGDFGVGLGYTDKENIGDKITLSGSYSFGDTTVEAFVARASVDAAGTFGFAAGDDSETEYGIGFTHSLGGAVLAGGISEDYTNNMMADLGIRFGF